MVTSVTDFTSKKHPNFYCENCDFICCKKGDYNRHLMTAKHKNMQFGDILHQKTSLHKCTFCFKNYNSRNGLWSHNKKCNTVLVNRDFLPNEEQDKSEIKMLTNLVLEVVKSNNDLQKQNYDFQNQIVTSFNEVMKNGINSNNNNTINSHNKTFNLQLFLNETCKDAMNMSEFIDSMKLQLSDLESVGKLGFVDGISNIIINNLKALDVEKRPVHCSDAKRETMYIKDQDRWEKEDDELNKMKQMIRQVRDKNISLITSWRDLYPECLLINSKKTDQYNNICMESFGFKKEKEEKIISKIAKSVVINKDMNI
jgi:hypothetical protein